MSDDDEIGIPPSKRLKRSVNRLNIANLPEDVILNVFKYLDFVTLTKISGLCKKFYDVYNDPKLYTDVYLKHDMDTNYMTAFINKVAYPKKIHIEYKEYDAESPEENYSVFDEYVTWLVRKCSSTILDFTVENCRNDYILMLVCECRLLNIIKCVNCKGNLDALSTFKKLKSVSFVNCDILTKIINDALENNGDLIKLHLENNQKVNLSEICQVLSKNNKNLQELHISDIKKIRMKGLRSICQLNNLKTLELCSSSFSCEPDDAIELIAAGCPFLERLTIKGWNNISDHRLMPIIHFSHRLKELELINLNITIKICREAALSLPFLENISISNCKNILEREMTKLETDFDNIIVNYVN